MMTTADPAERLPGRLKARRNALGLSQDEAARRTGVTLRTWQRWESGATKGHLAHLPAMAKALETTPEELLGVSDPEADPRGLEDLALEDRLRRIEGQQAAILQALQALGSKLADPREVLREAEALLESERPESDSQ